MWVLNKIYIHSSQVYIHICRFLESQDTPNGLLLIDYTLFVQLIVL